MTKFFEIKILVAPRSATKMKCVFKPMFTTLSVYQKVCFMSSMIFIPCKRDKTAMLLKVIQEECFLIGLHET